ncbi:alpha/beta hydrolase [Clostridiaceae bacterium HSG29]|nr:alpha/beta hydrolase [Clostridiaceae bacterium HSG29]
MPYLDVNHGKLYYEEEGNGSVLLLITPFGYLQSIWHKQVKFFSKHYRVITYDLRGVGKSTNEMSKISKEILLDDLYHIITHISNERVNLLGIGKLGYLAQYFALLYPDRIESLGLVSSSYGGPNSLSIPFEILQHIFKLVNYDEKIAKALCFKETSTKDEKVCEEVLFHKSKKVEKNIYEDYLMMFANTNNENALKNLKVDTWINTGCDNEIYLVENSKKLHFLIAHSEYQILTGGYLNFYTNSEEFNKAYFKFLNKKGGKKV